MLLRLLPIAALASLAACEIFPTATGSCQGVTAVAAPDTLYSEAFHNDCSGPGDVDGDIYQFTLIAQADLLFRMSPTGFRGSMGLYRGVYGDPNPKLIFEVLGPGSAPFGARAYLPVGQYFLMAGPAGRSGGEYAVAFTPTSAADCSVFDWTDFGADITGSITTADCSITATSFHDSYGIWLAAGESIQVTGIAGAKPLGIALRKQGVAGDPIASRSLAISASETFTYTAESKGAYSIQAIGLPGSIGPIGYTLQVRRPP
jgi:hypothetical protein